MRLHWPPPVELFAEDAETLRGVRIGLEEARRRGLVFDQAWNSVLHVALDDLPADDRGGWRLALDATKATWQAAYGQTALQHAA